MPFGKLATVALKSAFKTPATRVKPREPFAATRGQIVYNVDTCTFCTLCMRKCPPGAITVDRVARTFEIDYLRCIVCNACVGVCNPKSLTMSNVIGEARTDHQVRRWHKDAPAPAAKPADKPAGA